MQPEIVQLELPIKFNTSPNISLQINKEGMIFIGKEDGLVIQIADKYYYTATEAPVYLAALPSGRIIYLTRNDIGYLKIDKGEIPAMKSLADKIPAHFRNFLPKQAIAHGKQVFLNSSEGIFLFKDGNIQHFFEDRQDCHLWYSGSNLFLEVPGQGLKIWRGSAFELCLPEEEYSHIHITGISDVHSGIRVFTEEGQDFMLNLNLQILEKVGNRDKIISGVNYGTPLQNAYTFLISSDGKPMFASPEYEQLLPLISSTDLPPQRPVQAFMDNFKDIWLVYDYNIFKIEFDSRVLTLDLSSLVSGTIYNSAFHKNILYMSANNGIYRINVKKDHCVETQLICSMPSSAGRYLESNGKILICGGSSGISELKGPKMVPVLEGKFSFVKILDDNQLIALDEEALKRWYREGSGWRERALETDINQVITSARLNQELFLISEKEELYKITSDSIQIFDLKKIIHNQIARLLKKSNQLYLLLDNSAFIWNTDTESFLPVNGFREFKHLCDADLLLNTNDIIWSSTRDTYGGYTLWRSSPGENRLPFFEIHPDRQFGQILDIDESEDIIWISSKSKLIRLNKESINQNESDLLRINSVSIENQTINGDHEIQPGEKIKYKRADLTISLANKRMVKEPQSYYRYRLTHYQDEWSSWSRNKRIIIKNIHERKYNFEAQALYPLGLHSDPVSYDFTITPPIYRRWYALVLYSILLLTGIFFAYKYRMLKLKNAENVIEERIREKMETVLHEKEKSDRLVEDLFPKGTAEEIKSSGRAKSKKYELVTVLFSDIQGFTKIAEEMNPEVLIDELDKFFFHFDSVVEKYNIEKIKTIGDAYMAAGGIPVKNSSNPVEVVLAGMEMQYYMQELRKKKAEIWDLRIGIHTGPVISGVVGHKKLSYDIWGDTVNTASRMESSGEGGKVNISGVTYSMVKDYFICEYRGKLPVKYKGNIDMYFVKGLRPELSVDLKGIPNRRFFIKLQLLRLKDIEARVVEHIFGDKKLDFHFHKPEFLHKVSNQVELLCRSENITDDELLLTQTASLLMYAGLPDSYENYEHKSVEIARNILPEYSYDEKQIDRICNLILSAREPYQPQNLLEKILIDAKMEYLGRMDYISQVKLLFLELKANLDNISRESLVKQQLKLLNSFEFFTVAGRRLREVDKEIQIESLKSWDRI